MDTLDNLEIGNKCIIKRLENNDDIKRRFLDIGLIPGTVVECLFKSPFGDLSAYDIRGCVMAIRNSDAKNILIEGYYE